MRKTKSKASYTNKWLSRNKRFWHIEHFNEEPVIIIDKKDAPKIVIKRVQEINARHGWSGRGRTNENFLRILVGKEIKQIADGKQSNNNGKRLSIYTDEEIKHFNEEEFVDEEYDDSEVDFGSSI